MRKETFHRTTESSVTTTEEDLNPPKLELPLGIVLLYLLFGGLWILLSDRICVMSAHPGTIIEISDISGGKGRFFGHIRKAAASWDGGDPVRVIES